MSMARIEAYAHSHVVHWTSRVAPFAKRIGTIMDIDNNLTADQSFESPGARFNYLLDRIGFKQGRGRATELQNFLIEHSPDLFNETTTKYTTVRSWLLDATPSMRKIDAIVSALGKNYTFHEDVSAVKTWWKVGGRYPVASPPIEAKASLLQLQQSAKDYEESLQFIVAGMVTHDTADFANALTDQDLRRIKDNVVKFGTDFADPFKTVCPVEYLKMAVRHEMSVLLDQKIRSR